MFQSIKINTLPTILSASHGKIKDNSDMFTCFKVSDSCIKINKNYFLLSYLTYQ